MQYNPRVEEAYNLFHDGTLAFARAEEQGMRVDTEYIDRKLPRIYRMLEVLEEEFKETSFFKHWQHTVRGTININSNIQLSHFLYNVKKIKIEKKTISGQGATDDEAIQQIADLYNLAELRTLLEVRRLIKVKNYLEMFKREQVDGFIHPFFNLNLVQTYRSSSDHPNFQNLPKRDEQSMKTVRKALYPRKGHQLLEVDYSGIEVRIAACYHKDPMMIKYIKDPTTDMHGDMAKQIFLVDKFDKSLPEHYTLRQAAKNGFVFPQFYGAYYVTCANNLACTWGKLPQDRWRPGQGLPMPNGKLSEHLIGKGIKSYDTFVKHLQRIEEDFWGNRFAKYAEWKDTWYNMYRKQGYVDLLTGFRCSGVMDRKQVINFPVQGAAFHCLLWSFNRLDKIIQEQKWKTRLIGQVHDSIILDVHPKELAIVTQMIHKVTCKDLLKAWNWIIVPLDIEMELCPIDTSWADKEKYNFL